MSSEARAEGGVTDIWDALRRYRDDHKDLQGEMLADRRVAEERHRQTNQQFSEIKSFLTTLSGLIADQGATMTRVDQGQQSILQTMESDRQTRIETASALEAAEKARRQLADGPWVTPNRVVGLVLGIAAVLAYVGNNLS